MLLKLSCYLVVQEQAEIGVAKAHVVAAKKVFQRQLFSLILQRHVIFMPMRFLIIKIFSACRPTRFCQTVQNVRSEWVCVIFLLLFANFAR